MFVPWCPKARDKSETRKNRGNHKVILRGAVEDYKHNSRSIVLRNCGAGERCQKSEDRQMFSQRREMEMKKYYKAMSANAVFLQHAERIHEADGFGALGK